MEYLQDVGVEAECEKLKENVEQVCALSCGAPFIQNLFQVSLKYCAPFEKLWKYVALQERDIFARFVLISVYFTPGIFNALRPSKVKARNASTLHTVVFRLHVHHSHSVSLFVFVSQKPLSVKLLQKLEHKKSEARLPDICEAVRTLTLVIKYLSKVGAKRLVIHDLLWMLTLFCLATMWIGLSAHCFWRTFTNLTSLPFWH